jgi:hypothetical protein
MLHMLPLVLHLVRNLRWVFVIFVNRGGGEILSVNLVAGRWTKVLFDGCVCIFSVGTCCWFLTCAQHDRKVYDLPFLARCKGSGSSEGDATDGSQITGAEQFTGNRGFAHIPSNTFFYTNTIPSIYSKHSKISYFAIQF